MPRFDMQLPREGQSPIQHIIPAKDEAEGRGKFLAMHPGLPKDAPLSVRLLSEQAVDAGPPSEDPIAAPVARILQQTVPDITRAWRAIDDHLQALEPPPPPGKVTLPADGPGLPEGVEPPEEIPHACIPEELPPTVPGIAPPDPTITSPPDSPAKPEPRPSCVPDPSQPQHTATVPGGPPPQGQPVGAKKSKVKPATK